MGSKKIAFLLSLLILLISLFYFSCVKHQANSPIYYLARSYGDTNKVIQEHVYETAWSPDGSRLLVCSAGKAFIFDAETRKVVWSTKEWVSPLSASFSEIVVKPEISAKTRLPSIDSIHGIVL